MSPIRELGSESRLLSPGARALPCKLWRSRGWHSHAQVRQGISSEDEGFVHVMGELEHTAREQRGLAQRGVPIQDAERLDWASQLPAASPRPSCHLPLPFSPHPQPVTPQDLTIFSSDLVHFPDCTWRH